MSPFQDYLCTKCEEAHARVRLTKSHIIERVEPTTLERPKETTTSEIIETPFADLSYFCRAHAEECLYWCHTCARPCCDSCLREPDHHANHETERRKSDRKKISLDKISQRLEEMMTKKNELEENRVKLASIITEKRQQITTTSNQLINMVKSEETRLNSELDKILLQSDEKYTADIEKISNMTAALAKIKSDDNNEENASKLLSSPLPTCPTPEVHLTLNDHIHSLGSIKTTVVCSQTRVYGPGLEFVHIPTHNEDWSEFFIYPRGWLDESVDVFEDFSVQINPEPSCFSYDKSSAFFGVKFMPKARVDHNIEVFYLGQLIGRWCAKHYDKRDYRKDLRPLTIGQTGKKPGQFSRPWGICAVPGGGVAVSDRANNRIQILDSNGEVALVHPKDIENSVFNRPAGIAFTLKPEPSLIIADKDNHQIQIYRYKPREIIFKLKFGSKGTSPGQFEYPWDVACNSRGQIACADSRNHRIQLFNSKGDLISKYGFTPSPCKYFDYPRGLHFDRDDKLYATDFNLHRVLVINPQLTEAHFVGSQGSTHGRFHRPQGIAIDSFGRIIVSDTKNKRIQIFKPDCTFLHEYTQLERPAGICVTTDGRIAIVEEDENLSQIVFL